MLRHRLSGMDRPPCPANLSTVSTVSRQAIRPAVATTITLSISFDFPPTLPAPPSLKLSPLPKAAALSMFIQAPNLASLVPPVWDAAASPCFPAFRRARNSSTARDGNFTALGSAAHAYAPFTYPSLLSSFLLAPDTRMRMVSRHNKRTATRILSYKRALVRSSSATSTSPHPTTYMQSRLAFSFLFPSWSEGRNGMYALKGRTEMGTPSKDITGQFPRLVKPAMRCSTTH
mmetsp:Transcript_35548/g.49344  ORF Transcript_35548/g.49344 Transcript_35548/m.49344 type:complete len:231 (-) Transcript_35548:336-1028(-)